VTVRALVVDDHPVFRDGLAALLSSLDDVAVAGVAADAESALAFVGDSPVDVVLMDLNLQGLSGVEATSRLTSLTPAPAVLVVTMVDDDDTVVAALRAGARGYVLKGATGEEIAAAVRTVAAGGAVFGAGVAAQVLTLIAEGSSNAQIARALGLSVKTVQNYVSRILDKLQLADRTQAALHAQRRRDSP
jgi:DNA-binding NarL/FixJ family response regulator